MLSNKILFCMLPIVAILIFPGLLQAQINRGSASPFGVPTFGSGNVVDAPIDGGLSILVVAGVGYGMKKLKERRMYK